MKRRKNDYGNGKNKVRDQDKTKRFRAEENDENQDPNNGRSDVQVKSIFNRLIVGINNIPEEENVAPPLHENTPSANRKNGK